MKGWLYKEIRHYRYLLFAALLVPAFCIWMPLLLDFFGGIGERSAPLHYAFRSLYDQSAVYFLYLIMSLLIIGMLLLTVFVLDATKKWAYFVGTTPDGIGAFLNAKYLFVLIICAAFYLSVFWNEALLITIGYMAYGIELPGISDFVLMMMFLILLLRAADFAAMARFGTQTGARVKGYCLLVIFVVGVIWLLFGPLPDDFESALSNVFEFVTKLINGTYSEQIGVIIGLLPPVALLAYYLSFKLSCRFYMKGVEHYEK